MEKKEDVKHRKRSENWNESDKMLLKELIRKRVSSIENKNTDTNTNQAKKKSWLEVQESFNNLCTGGQRTMIQLKTQWTATKVTARKQVSDHRKEILRTGGGEAPEERPVCSNDISVWLPNEFVIDTNEFDSDVVHESIEIGVDDCRPLKEENLDEEEVVIVGNKIPENKNQNVKYRKKIVPAKRKNTQTEENIKRLTEFDIECRRELHELQVEAEKKRLRNLDREYDLIEARIKYYENKSFDYTT